MISLISSFRSNRNRKILPQRHRSPIIAKYNNKHKSSNSNRFIKTCIIFCIAIFAVYFSLFSSADGGFNKDDIKEPNKNDELLVNDGDDSDDQADPGVESFVDGDVDGVNGNGNGNGNENGNGDASDGADTTNMTIGYAISLTGCPKDGSTTLIDGAAVLRHSIHLNSLRAPSPSSKYDYKMYAIVHPSALPCSDPLRQIGYELLVKDIPVPLEDIQGEFLKERLPKNGCCGEKEFIKLYAYTLTRHPAVVHLDLDTVVLQPMDDLFDAMLSPPSSSSPTDDAATKTLLHAMWHDKPLPPRIDAYFTRDYNMVSPTKKHPGVQGGFLVLRPSLASFESYASVIRAGDFRQRGGWGGTEHGTFYGGMTFQGIVPYFYDDLNPGTAVELNRCVWNQMADNPRDGRTVDNIVHGRCRDGRSECEDCRERRVGEVKTAHFTLCQKPWDCLTHDSSRIQDGLCREMHGEWFRIRADLELSWEGKRLVDEDEGNVAVVGEGKLDQKHFRGFCDHSGGKGYIPIKLHPAVK